MAEKPQPKKKTGSLTRKEKDQVYKSLGLIKVKGMLGGTYYE
jgi:hypothetical protein